MGESGWRWGGFFFFFWLTEEMWEFGSGGETVFCGRNMRFQIKVCKTAGFLFFAVFCLISRYLCANLCLFSLTSHTLFFLLRFFSPQVTASFSTT